LSRALRAELTSLGLAAAILAGLSGCGEDSDEEAVTSGPTPAAELAEPPPRGASPLLEDVYRQFQPPSADPQVRGSGRALRKGLRTCRGKTALEIRERFIGESDLTAEQRKLVNQLPRFERNPTANFVAGQLGALVYEKSLPEDELATFGFQGCVYGLSLRLKRELAKAGGN